MHQLLLLLPAEHQASTCQLSLHAAAQQPSPAQQQLLQRLLQRLRQAILLLLCVLAAAGSGCLALKTSEAHWMPPHYWRLAVADLIVTRRGRLAVMPH
jgi:hypothetical protein